MPKSKVEKSDDAQFDFEVGKDEDSKAWRLTITCGNEEISEQEFGAACISLGTDILEGIVSFDEAEEIAVDKYIGSKLN